MRRTKIVATIGPASSSEDALRKLIEAGVDVVRLNFAHGDAESHSRTAARVRSIAEGLGRHLGILVDLPGPKLRTGEVREGAVRLHAGDEFVLTSNRLVGDERGVSVGFWGLTDLVSEGDKVFLGDGEIVLRATNVVGEEVVTEVVRGGVLRSRKGMHVPGAELKLECFGDDDRRAMEAAIAMGADFAGLSFVRDERDLERARAALPTDALRPQLVAKIETAAAVEHIDGIIKLADAVMVARGDLGIQLPLSQIPILQKEIVRACRDAGKPVITATQMLESMTESPVPTRAEVTDVANAVFEGTDAVMLSEETAVGEHPVEAVRTMTELAEVAEERAVAKNITMGVGLSGEDPVAWAVAHAAVEAAEDLDAAAILCATRTGSTPRRVAAHRPAVPVVGLSSVPECLGGLSLAWGVIPLGLQPGADETNLADAVNHVRAAALDAGLADPGDVLVVTAGSTGPRAGATDFLQIVRA